MRKNGFIGLVLGLALLVCGSTAMASDTSPYLIGAWENTAAYCYGNGDSSRGEINQRYFGCGWTEYILVNPTPSPLTIFAAFFDNSGSFLGCTRNTINANAKWYIPGYFLEEAFGLGYEDWMGTAKFFAFPVPTPPTAIPRSYNSSMVIGGYQLKYVWDDYNYTMTRSESNLNGVALNPVTSMEFSNLLKMRAAECILFQEPDIGPK
jgi:hypothetical protein